MEWKYKIWIQFFVGESQETVLDFLQLDETLLFLYWKCANKKTMPLKHHPVDPKHLRTLDFS